MANPNENEKPAKAAKSEKRWRWIINNEERARIMNLRGVVNSTTKMSTPGGSFTLIPGATLVDNRQWEKWKAENGDRTVEGEEGDDAERVSGQATQLLRTNIPRGTHRTRTSEGAGKPYLVEGPTVKSKDTPIADLDDAKAIEIVNEIGDEALLRRMLATERRSAVAESIRRTIEGFAAAEAQKSA